MKRILFVMNTMGRAGAETALVELMRRLSETGEYDISLYTLIPYGEMFASVPEGVHVLNKRVSQRSVLSPSGRLAIAGRLIGAFFYRATGFRMLGYFARNLIAQKKSGRVQPDKLMWRMLSEGTPRQRGDFDLAVAYLEGASTYYVAGRVSAKKKASFIHIDYVRAGYLPMMDGGCYDSIDRIFTVSEQVRAQFLKVYPACAEKTFLFRNLLGRDMILKKAAEGEGFADDYKGFRLVTVGRLHYQKGYDVAIEALKILRDRGYEARWYVLGEGPERGSLESQIDKAGLRGQFVLMGAKANPYPYVRMADIYVHATRFEGKSIAIEEAQILGKVIAASDCTGNTEQIVNEYDGLLFPLSAENIAGAVSRLMDDPSLCKLLAERVQEKELEHPEDMERLISLIS